MLLVAKFDSEMYARDCTSSNASVTRCGMSKKCRKQGQRQIVLRIIWTTSRPKKGVATVLSRTRDISTLYQLAHYSLKVKSSLFKFKFKSIYSRKKPFAISTWIFFESKSLQLFWRKKGETWRLKNSFLCISSIYVGSVYGLTKFNGFQANSASRIFEKTLRLYPLDLRGIFLNTSY